MEVPTTTYRPEGFATELGVKTVNVGIVLTIRTEDVVTFIVGISKVGIS